MTISVQLAYRGALQRSGIGMVTICHPDPPGGAGGVDQSRHGLLWGAQLAWSLVPHDRT
jgi:hypothetical protein